MVASKYFACLCVSNNALQERSSFEASMYFPINSAEGFAVIMASLKKKIFGSGLSKSGFTIITTHSSRRRKAVWRYAFGSGGGAA